MRPFTWVKTSEGCEIVVFVGTLYRGPTNAQLVVFDALPHAFWLDEKLPESQEADGLMAHFFTSHLGK